MGGKMQDNYNPALNLKKGKLLPFMAAFFAMPVRISNFNYATP